MTGYPPEDLLLRPGFVRAAEQLARGDRRGDARRRSRSSARRISTRDLFNACAVCADGEVKAFVKKRFLPNYGVFDEMRYFAPGDELFLLRLGDAVVGVTVCEDMWQPGPPATDLALAGAQLLVNVSASPFHVGKDREREEMFRIRARDNAAFVAFCNTVGGQDELVFDGHSVVLDDEGKVLARAPGFEEALLVVDVDPTAVVGRRLPDVRRRALARDRGRLEPVRAIQLDAPREQADAAAPAIAPFVGRARADAARARARPARLRAQERLLATSSSALSGGIDSALTAAIAAEALGPDRVHCVSMPSRYSSEGTRTDARAARGERSAATSARSRSSRSSRRSARRSRRRSPGREPDLTEENVQARIRGTLLMALSNKFGWLLVATGNKSELSVGYATLYGDMAGGFALLKDVFKTDVFRLSRHLNERAGRELIPASIIERPPSAELRPDQLDEDSLPPYAQLDEVLEAYVEQDRSLEELSADGFDRGRRASARSR